MRRPYRGARPRATSPQDARSGWRTTFGLAGASPTVLVGLRVVSAVDSWRRAIRRTAFACIAFRSAVVIASRVGPHGRVWRGLDGSIGGCHVGAHEGVSHGDVRGAVLRRAVGVFRARRGPVGGGRASAQSERPRTEYAESRALEPSGRQLSRRCSTERGGQLLSAERARLFAHADVSRARGARGETGHAASAVQSQAIGDVAALPAGLLWSS
jgi:hypothetical protein